MLSMTLVRILINLKKYSNISNLIKSMNEYSISINEEKLAREIVPMFLLFFFQWNISQVKLYSKHCHIDLKKELEEASNNIEFMQYIKIL